MKGTRLGRILAVYGLSLMGMVLNSCSGMTVLNPKGPVGHQEMVLIYTAIGLMLIVIMPVFVMAIWFSIRYRASNTKATFKPNWEGSRKVEAIVWLVPVLIVAVLSYFTWIKTNELDPYKQVKSSAAPLRVQVVSLDWNWLFIYPDYDVATVNQLVLPAGVPISFDLTSASVMTSFFIPQLGSQMYAMAGMTTHLNLLASEPGTYRGQNQEFSGDGYESMHFPAIAEPAGQFLAWTKEAKGTGKTLDMAGFETLSRPRAGYPATVYSSVAPGLFAHIVGQYMDWKGDMSSMGRSEDQGGAMQTPSDQGGSMNMSAGDGARTQDN